MAQIQVRDTSGNAIPGIRYRISVGSAPSDQAIYDNLTDGAGNGGWPIPFWPTGQYTLHFNTQDINPKWLPVSVPVNHDHDVFVILDEAPPVPITLTRVICGGHDFFNANGRWFMKGVTDFLLYKKYLDGEDITPLLKERASFGANCVRVIGMVSSFSHWYPQEYGNRYYDEIPAFLRLLESYGLYCYFTVFADTQIVMPGKVAQLQHFGRVVPKLLEVPNSLIELVNEPYAHSNRTDDPYAFPRPYGIVASSGSYNDKYGGNPTPGPHWDFHDFHTPRDGHNGGFKYCADQVMTANPNYRKLGQPVLSGEPQKFADPSDPTRGNSTLSSPEQARMMAGSASGTACGIVYHTPGGVFSRPWNDVEKACAVSWFETLR